ncbi:MAG: AraC family transcriptional regulator [Oscillospiraceae bacterium]|jgi:AraC-like DNA-binding protein|nr:AraC family transcriptional regulator [Oscillospiraceae bacterium]
MDRQWLASEGLQFAFSSAATVALTEARAFQGLENTLRLLFVSSGDCHAELGQRKERLVGDRMLLMQGALGYRIEKSSEDCLLTQLDFSYMPCVLPSWSLCQLYHQYPDYRLYCQSAEDCLSFHDRFSLVRFTAKSLVQYAAYPQPHRTILLTMALCYLMQVISSAGQDKTRDLYQYNKYVRRAIQYMHENYMGNITAEDIASYTGIHSGYLHRLFRTELGARVTEYLTDLRIEKAKSLLKRTDIPIASITALVGVSTQQYLCRMFRQHVGMTPQEYRRSYNVTCDYGQARAHYEVFETEEEAR